MYDDMAVTTAVAGEFILTVLARLKLRKMKQKVLYSWFSGSPKYYQVMYRLPLSAFSLQAFLTSSFRHTLVQCCPTFLYIGAHLTDGRGGAGAVWLLQ
jgi:hypothetical protein